MTRIKTIEELEQKKLTKKKVKQTEEHNKYLLTELISIIKSVKNPLRKDGETYNRISSKIVKNTSKNFKVWLSTNFKSNREFLDFLNTIVATSDDKELITFITEYKALFGKPLNENRYLRWNNYTVYKKRSLFMVVYSVFFGNSLKKKILKTTIRGIMAKASKSKRQRKEDVGTSKEYMYTIQRPANETERWLKYNARKLKNGVITGFETEALGDYALKDKPFQERETKTTSYSMKETDKEVNKQMGIIKTYAFKFMPQFNTAFSQNSKMQRTKEIRVKKREKYATKGLHITNLQNHLTKNKAYDLFKGCEYNNTITRRMTALQQMMRYAVHKNYMDKVLNGSATDKNNNSFIVAYENKCKQLGI